MRPYLKFAGPVVVGICLGFVIWFGYLRPVTGASQEPSKRPLLKKLPPIKNCVDHIKIINAELKMQGDLQVASIEVENEAYIGIVSISLEQAVYRGKQSYVPTGFSPNKPPMIIIEPGARITLVLGNLESRPLRIGGAMFSDGTEEGCESSLKDMRELKESNTKKGGSQK